MIAEPTTTRAVGYARVSTAGQADDGVSLDAQSAKIRAWCAVHDADLLDIYIDGGISGKRADNRPGLQSALDAACKHKAALVVYSLSRLARRTRDTLAIAERLEKAGADLASLSERIDTTSAAGKMVFRMLAVLAEFERDQVSERTSMALKHMRANGQRVSRFDPFGFKQDPDDPKRLIEEPHEQEAIGIMLDLRSRGLAYAKIGEALEGRGYTGRHGQRLSAKVIGSVVRRAQAGQGHDAPLAATA